MVPKRSWKNVRNIADFLLTNTMSWNFEKYINCEKYTTNYKVKKVLLNNLL